MPNILIVEDDININNLLCEVLRKAGYTVCSSGRNCTSIKRNYALSPQYIRNTSAAEYHCASSV